MTRWIDAGTEADVRRRKVVVPLDGGESALVLFHDGRFAAFSNVCVHRQKLLERGVILNGRLICPGHQWAFDLDSGWEAKMERCQPMYDVRVADGVVQIDLDSRALRVGPDAGPCPSPDDPAPDDPAPLG